MQRKRTALAGLECVVFENNEGEICIGKLHRLSRGLAEVIVTNPGSGGSASENVVRVRVREPTCHPKDTAALRARLSEICGSMESTPLRIDWIGRIVC